ncbi:MAG: LamG-like jellyroll fold domain-containing protein, partial [Methanosarcinaceae archaeon]
FYVKVSHEASTCIVMDNDVGVSIGETDAGIDMFDILDADIGVLTQNASSTITSTSVYSCDECGVKSLHSAVSVSGSNLSNAHIGFKGYADRSELTSTTLGSNDNGSVIDSESTTGFSCTFTDNNHSIFSIDSTPRITASDLTDANKKEVYSTSGSDVSLVGCEYTLNKLQIESDSTVLEDWQVSIDPFDYIVPTVDESDPRGHWSFDKMYYNDDEYRTYDSSVYDEPATVGGIEVDTDVVDGKIGACFEFDGIDDYVNLGDKDYMDAPDYFTVSMWFRRDVDRSGTVRDTNHLINNVLIAQSSNTYNDNFELGTEGSNIEVYLDTPSKDGILTHDIGIADDTWYHLVMTYDKDDTSEEVKIYLDGESVKTWGDWGGTLDSSVGSELCIGMARPDNQMWGEFSGSIDDVRLYTRVLSPTEVMNLTLLREDDTIITVYDESGNTTYTKYFDPTEDSVSFYLAEKEIRASNAWEYRTPHNVVIGETNQFQIPVFSSESIDLVLDGDSDGDYFDDENETSDNIIFFDAVDFVNESKTSYEGAVQLSTDPWVFNDTFPINHTGYYKYFVRAKLTGSTASNVLLNVMMDTSVLVFEDEHPIDSYWKWFQTDEFQVSTLPEYIRLSAYDSAGDEDIVIDKILLVRIKDGSSDPTDVRPGIYTDPHNEDTDGDGLLDGMETADSSLWYEAEYYDVASYSTVGTDVYCENGMRVVSTTTNQNFLEITDIPFERDTIYEVWVRCSGTEGAAFEIWHNSGEITSADIEPTTFNEPEWVMETFTSPAGADLDTIRLTCKGNTVYVDRVMIVAVEDVYTDKYYNNSIAVTSQDIHFDSDGEFNEIDIQVDWNDYVSTAILTCDEANPYVHKLTNGSTEPEIDNRIDSDGDYVVYDNNSKIYLYNIRASSNSVVELDSDAGTATTKAAIHGDFVVWFDLDGSDYSIRIHDITTGYSSSQLFQSTDRIYNVDIWGDNIVFQRYSSGKYRLYFYNFNGDDDHDGVPNYQDSYEEELEICNSSALFSPPRLWNDIIAYIEDPGTGSSELKGAYYTFSGDIEEGDQSADGI